jgi:hypothetical protein
VTYTAPSAYVDRCVDCGQPAAKHDWPGGACQAARPAWTVIHRADLDRLLEIERQADWVRKGREISRQAALNAIPDLIKALKQ